MRQIKMKLQRGIKTLISTVDCSKNDPVVAKLIDNFVGCLTDPIIYHKGQNGSPPDFIREAIKISRLLENMAANKENRQPTGTDAECSWYLSTASLEAPFNEQWTRIYGYCFTKTREICNQDVPEDLRVDTLDNYDMGYLKDLKEWIYKVRSENRMAAASKARHVKREEKANETITLQPAMFEF
jgi:hypothetical protein